jgi:hypothetical protein
MKREETMTAPQEVRAAEKATRIALLEAISAQTPDASAADMVKLAEAYKLVVSSSSISTTDQN